MPTLPLVLTIVTVVAVIIDTFVVARTHRLSDEPPVDLGGGTTQKIVVDLSRRR